MADNTIRLRAVLQDAVSKPITGIQTKLKGLQSQAGQSVLTGVGLGAGVAGFGAVTQAIEGTIGFMGDAISKASDLNETINKSQVVFGRSAAGIKQWGETAATSMGLSENAAIGAASTIGNLLLSTGTAPEKIAPMSKSIVQLASDLASFNNISTDDALAKLESGLVGQERPLRELGVAISAASVDSEALALGFHKVNGEFTEGEKVQARYALIFAQTGTAQGDFARTSDQLANSQRILQAEIEDTKAKIGNELMPVVRNAVVGFDDFFAAVGGSNKATVEGLEDQLGLIIKTSGSLQDYKDILGQIQYEQASLAAGGLETTQEVDALNNALGIAQFYVDKIQGDKDALKNLGFQTVVSDLNDMGSAAQAADLTSLKKNVVIAGDDAKSAGLKFQSFATQIATAGNNAQAAVPHITALYGAIYGKSEAKGNLADAKLALMDINQQIKDLQAKPKQSTADKLQLQSLNGQLATAKQNVIDAEIVMAKLGDKPAKADLQKFLDSTATKVLAIGSDAELSRLEIQKLLNVPGINDNTATKHKGDAKHKAAGGPVDANKPYVVGENGPEWFVPGQSGSIIPNGNQYPGSASAPGGGGGVIRHFHDVQVTVAGGVLTPAAARELGTAIGPALVAWQQRNNVLPRVGSPQRG